MVIIKQLEKDDWLEVFNVMHELRPHLTETTYLELLNEMELQGYKMFALYEEDVLVAVTGVSIITNLYYGRHVYVYDLVTTNSKRSKGYGEKLLSYLENWGKENDCETIALSSALFRTDAHRFYEHKMNYEKPSFVFKKTLQ
ncbi:GNAT family N-acetyltransferase [Bacillus sp. 31A1R]|uniref:GNAT family N-acetyltransferase n=1 Tax=Robertmurraya mangrovi TaxID=3098077 RepID=A0ABU5J0P1_9BACI|nr:GNAT family N-acetyltransferase [Bacillus sp. 31A1R]MDZ5472973.1 GNAT family N-acetyltransferase [Bacillus sp. 31A1R]